MIVYFDQVYFNYLSQVISTLREVDYLANQVLNSSVSTIWSRLLQYLGPDKFSLGALWPFFIDGKLSNSEKSLHSSREQIVFRLKVVVP